MAAKKVGFVATHGAENPELATLPFMLAAGALTMGVEPVIILQAEGVRLAIPGYAETIRAEGMSPLEDLLSAVLAAGHRIMACSPCLTLRGFTDEDVRDGFFVGGAAKVIESMLECENMLRY